MDRRKEVRGALARNWIGEHVEIVSEPYMAYGVPRIEVVILDGSEAGRCESEQVRWLRPLAPLARQLLNEEPVPIEYVREDRTRHSAKEPANG